MSVACNSHNKAEKSHYWSEQSIDFKFRTMCNAFTKRFLFQYVNKPHGIISCRASERSHKHAKCHLLMAPTLALLSSSPCGKDCLRERVMYNTNVSLVSVKVQQKTRYNDCLAVWNKFYYLYPPAAQRWWASAPCRRGTSRSSAVQSRILSCAAQCKEKLQFNTVLHMHEKRREVILWTRVTHEMCTLRIYLLYRAPQRLFCNKFPSHIGFPLYENNTRLHCRSPARTVEHMEDSNAGST